MTKRPRIERKNGRIYFGEGQGLWSVTDPWMDLSEPSLGALGLARDFAYVLVTCPTNAEALQKLRLIRWALKNVPAQRPNRGGDNG